MGLRKRAKYPKSCKDALRCRWTRVPGCPQRERDNLNHHHKKFEVSKGGVGQVGRQEPGQVVVSDSESRESGNRQGIVEKTSPTFISLLSGKPVLI